VLVGEERRGRYTAVACNTMRITQQLVVVTLFVLGSGNTNTASAIGSRRTQKPSTPWDRRSILPPRGGAFFNSNRGDDSNTNNNVTQVEDYVTKMKEKDEELDASASSNSDPAAPETTAHGNDDDDDDPAIVGVKSHGSSSKKSNAVGDPDGDDDDDDDDEDTELSEFSEWEEIQDNSFEPQVQVQVELLGEEEEETTTNTPSSGGGGVVGVKLGNRIASPSRRKNKWRSSSSQKKLSHDQTRLLQAWMPHVYFPPTPDALAYLDTNARLLDAGSKSRLDRRTLYAALLLEWKSTVAKSTTGTSSTTTGTTTGTSSTTGTSTSTKSSSGTRKFLPSPTSQALQAALSMATQPQWRLSSPGMNGIRLYAPDQETSGKGTTLGMQETVAMALVRTVTNYIGWRNYVTVTDSRQV
jgi:hypothetical protein